MVWPLAVLSFVVLLHSFHDSSFQLLIVEIVETKHRPTFLREDGVEGRPALLVELQSIIGASQVGQKTGQVSEGEDGGRKKRQTRRQEGRRCP